MGRCVLWQRECSFPRSYRDERGLRGPLDAFVAAATMVVPRRGVRSSSWVCWEGDAVTRPVRVVGLGGSLRAGSTSRTALQVGLEGGPRPGLTCKPVGLVCTAGGVQGLQAVNSMDFIARALRGWSVPLVLPVAQSARSFDPDGHLVDEGVAGQLSKLGGEGGRDGRQVQAEGSCDSADHRPFP